MQTCGKDVIKRASQTLCLLRAKGNTVHFRRFRTFLVNGETQGPSDLPALVDSRDDDPLFLNLP
jgi:hypothetical protein